MDWRRYLAICMRKGQVIMMLPVRGDGEARKRAVLVLFLFRIMHAGQLIRLVFRLVFPPIEHRKKQC